MAELTAPDPARVHALLVGIEHYPRFADRNLAGAAADAMRLARWLRRRGVPGRNIRLLLAPADASWAGLNTQERDLDVEIETVISRDQILDRLAPPRTVPEGDLLYVYWGGHGVVDRGDRRLLLCPDASDADPRCLDLMELRDYLTRPDVAYCRRQVFLVDACATFVKAGGPRPAVAVLPTGRRMPVEQFMLLAAASGQAATQRGVQRTGAFSTTVMDWLEEHSPGLDTDLDALVAHVKEHFTGHRLGSRQHQSPVTLVIQPVGGDVEIWQRSDPSASPVPSASSAPAAPAAPSIPVVAGSGAPVARPAPAGGGRRAGMWAGGGALAMVAMVAIVAMFLHGEGGDGESGDGKPDQAVPAAGAAVPGKEITASPPTPGTPAPSSSAPTAAAPAPQQPTAAPPANPLGERCGAGHTTTNVPDIVETVCVREVNGRISMVGYVKSLTTPKAVSVSLWLAGPNNTYVFPAKGPATKDLKATSGEERFEVPVTGLKAGDYEVHITTTEVGVSTQTLMKDPKRGHSMPFTYP